MSFVLTPSQLKILCKKYGLVPSKQYGQNFLVSETPIKQMISAADLNKDDTVLEIGPGFGILTFAVAPLVKKVICYEIEKKIKPYWEEKQKEFPNIEVIWGNAVSEMQNAKFKMQNYKVVANLPYQITSHVLRTLLELKNKPFGSAQGKPERIIVMVQKEVAERICAKHGDMSLLAVAVQYYGLPKIVAKVPSGNFWPAPKVDSAILDIRTKERNNEITFGDNFFFKVVKAGFASKRKQLWRNLSNLSDLAGFSADDIKKVVASVVGNEKARAEELSVEQWKELVRGLTKQLF